ncbi:MAG: four-helix bundle copper-binding protein [Chitinophagales bacterium]|nr:four-helix bundle copper-binding protein [Chitinophagales bacterium]
MKNEQTIAVIDACAAACNHCASACLQEEDVKMMSKCISLDMACAAICKATSTLLAQDSEHGRHLLRECIEVCEACADECEKHDHMGHCKQCAQACRNCAEACKSL